ncbi:hypothetical protein KIN20_019793 [Parelaphostrongylus tenuis]|uniref:Uncharacterized protein n=1 Tax=Parelaphostrongylus tenuis TaxID=148309 RepID=A0AAD5QT48_PARTN|nr:hypothetical protein KIN20_019793 [Parelaphostrongylus tenuis]
MNDVKGVSVFTSVGIGHAGHLVIRKRGSRWMMRFGKSTSCMCGVARPQALYSFNFLCRKGSKARPLAHLIEARKQKDAKSTKLISNPKLQRINSIWESGNGVVCLQIYHSISDDEAYVREAALIDAIRLENLTNVKAGEYRGKSKSWTLAMKAEFGTYQLERAWGVLKMEGLRPIMPHALPDSPFSHVSRKT